MECEVASVPKATSAASHLPFLPCASQTRVAGEGGQTLVQHPPQLIDNDDDDDGPARRWRGPRGGGWRSPWPPPACSGPALCVGCRVGGSG